MVFHLLLISALGSQQPIQNARSNFDTGNYAKAVQILMTADESDPHDSSIAYWMARCYYEMENYDKAVLYAEEAVKLAPQNAEYNRWLGRAYGGKAEQSRRLLLLARKVKGAFETAVHLAPNSIDARRDLMKYLVEAPWIVGGSKEQAKEQVEAISRLDPVEGRLAQAIYLSADKKWNEARAEYLFVLEQRPIRIEPYMEAADFFVDRKDADNLERTVTSAGRLNSGDPRLDFYHAVVLILQQRQLDAAQELLRSYIAKVPQRSDFPSHNQATKWLNGIGR